MLLTWSPEKIFGWEQNHASRKRSMIFQSANGANELLLWILTFMWLLGLPEAIKHPRNCMCGHIIWCHDSPATIVKTTADTIRTRTLSAGACIITASMLTRRCDTQKLILTYQSCTWFQCSLRHSYKCSCQQCSGMWHRSGIPGWIVSTHTRQCLKRISKWYKHGLYVNIQLPTFYF